jgi:hypothetical protein
VSDLRLDSDRPGVTESDVERADNIYALLAARARHEPDGRLAVDAAFGGIALATAPFLPNLWWALACPIVVVGAYGVWGLADRYRDVVDPTDAFSARRDLLTGVKGIAVAVGTGAAALAVWGFLRAATGNWIS